MFESRNNVRWSGRFALVSVLAVALAIVSSATASAATTFGADLTTAPGQSPGSLSITNVIKPDGSADNGAPVSGVLTSVRVKTTGDAGSGVIRILRQTAHPDASTYTVTNVAEIPISVTADGTVGGHVTEVATQTPIVAADRLGLRMTSDGAGNVKSQLHDAAVVAECAYTGGPHTVGTSLDYTTAACNHNVTLLAGTIEADADGDGFGDDTQDGCPSDASTQAPCPATTPTQPTQTQNPILVTNDAPFGGIALSAQTLRVKKGKVAVTLTCPIAAVGNCVGTDTLKTAGKVVAARKKAKILTLGKGSFSIAPGKSAKVAIKLTKPALRLLAKGKTVKAKQTVVASDSRNVAKTTSGSVKLKAAKAKKKR